VKRAFVCTKTGNGNSDKSNYFLRIECNTKHQCQRVDMSEITAEKDDSISTVVHYAIVVIDAAPTMTRYVHIQHNKTDTNVEILQSILNQIKLRNTSSSMFQNVTDNEISVHRNAGDGHGTLDPSANVTWETSDAKPLMVQINTATRCKGTSFNAYFKIVWKSFVKV
jgi:hypothetical protein